MPLMIVRAGDLQKSGYETPTELDADRAFKTRLEMLRVEAGQRMGFANAADLVIPKPVLIAPPQHDGTISGRYFMPASCHKAFAITGAVGLTTACIKPDTIASAVAGAINLPETITIEHPSGLIDVRLEKAHDRPEPVASLVRTARRLFEGAVFARGPFDAVHI
jgi:2-methylaconitate cis-trans-isomerase PrpF